jgi:hypothetical protein
MSPPCLPSTGRPASCSFRLLPIALPTVLCCAAGLPIREGPGAGFVLWAETAGATPIERVYSNSASLPGDAVLTFMRALCAVSQEELSPGKQGEGPGVGGVGRVGGGSVVLGVVGLCSWVCSMGQEEP